MKGVPDRSRNWIATFQCEGSQGGLQGGFKHGLIETAHFRRKQTRTGPQLWCPRPCVSEINIFNPGFLIPVGTLFVLQDKTQNYRWSFWPSHFPPNTFKITPLGTTPPLWCLPPLKPPPLATPPIWCLPPLNFPTALSLWASFCNMAGARFARPIYKNLPPYNPPFNLPLKPQSPLHLPPQTLFKIIPLSHPPPLKCLLPLNFPTALRPLGKSLCIWPGLASLAPATYTKTCPHTTSHHWSQKVPSIVSPPQKKISPPLKCRPPLNPPVSSSPKSFHR